MARKFLTPADLGGSKILNLGNGSAATDAAAYGQTPAGGNTATIAQGGTGQTTAAAAYSALSPMTTTGDLEYESSAGVASRLAIGSAGQFLGISGGVPAWSALPTGYSLYLAPTGATAETFSRIYAYTVSYVAPASGTLYVRAIPMAAGIAVNNITFFVGNTAEAGGSHGWYVLLDSNRTVRAVSADQTAAAEWGSTQTAVTLSVAGSGYTTTYAGLYYVGVCVVASTMPSFLCGTGTDTAFVQLAPILMGASSTSQTTPPSTGTTMTAITANGGNDFYAYTS